MIDLVISSGITGCETEILRLAKKYKIRTIGYTSLVLDNGELPDVLSTYNLEPVDDEDTAISKNIDVSDGVLWLSANEIPSDKYLDYKDYGYKKGISFFRVVAREDSIYEVAEKVCNWIFEKGISGLMVLCHSQEKGSKLHEFVVNLMESLIYMVLMKTDPTSLATPIHVKAPDLSSKSESVKSVVLDLIKNLPLKDKVTIANMTKSDLYEVFSTLGISILSKYYWPANNYLKDDCSRIIGKTKPEDYDIAETIILKLWEELKATHTLRII